MGLQQGNMPSAPSVGETEEQAKLRFQVEMEFVQSLANPNYLHFLAQRGFMKDQCFINYLAYLMYWKEPAYVSYLKYPVCLYFLELLQHETRRRARLFETATQGTQQGGQATPASAK